MAKTPKGAKGASDEQKKRITFAQKLQVAKELEKDTERFNGLAVPAVARMISEPLGFDVSPHTVRKVADELGITWEQPLRIIGSKKELQERIDEQTDTIEKLKAEIAALKEQVSAKTSGAKK